MCFHKFNHVAVTVTKCRHQKSLIWLKWGRNTTEVSVYTRIATFDLISEVWNTLIMASLMRPSILQTADDPTDGNVQHWIWWCSSTLHDTDTSTLIKYLANSMHAYFRSIANGRTAKNNQCMKINNNMINFLPAWLTLSTAYRIRENFRLTKISPIPDTYVLQKYLVE